MESVYGLTSESWDAIMASDRDVTLIYQGGSGGFFVYYLLLLSGKFVAGIDLSVEQCIAQQFPSDLVVCNWKASEVWPDNRVLKAAPCTKRRLYLICNPTFNTDCLTDNLHIASDTQVVLLQTPIRIQLRMAYDKRAYWFTPVSREHFAAPKSDARYLRWILSTAVEGYDPNLRRVRGLFKPEAILDLQGILDIDLNPDQREFRDHWLNLQSAKAQLRLKL